MTSENPRLLLVDSYDSFTHNLAALCLKAIPNASIVIIRNDEFNIHELRQYLSYFSAIIVGPGPGSPEIPRDIGVVRDLWKLPENDVLPIFGVCLGLQSLALEHGALLKRLHSVKHGQVSFIQHCSNGIFEKVGMVRAVRYHSLHVVLEEKGDIEQLAWTEDDENGKVTMAVSHKHRPYWGVQYHPESVCTEGGGIQVLQNFWQLAQSWTTKYGRYTQPWCQNVEKVFRNSWPRPTTSMPYDMPNNQSNLIYSSLKKSHISVVEICESLGVQDEASPFVLLESSAQPGRFSIVGCLSPSTIRLQYRVGDTDISILKEKSVSYESIGSEDIWTWLRNFMRPKKVQKGNANVPFWGGLIGCLTYELGTSGLNIPGSSKTAAQSKAEKHPDLNFIFVERSIVMDTLTGQTFVQSISPKDDQWVMQMVAKLEDLPPKPHSNKEGSLPSFKPSFIFPNKHLYISNILRAKEHLFAGDSYELCLTSQTRVRIPAPGQSSWDLYKRLRKSNPAPHSAYIRLNPTTLLSSSPERFLSFSRPPNPICQLRPIKGTVRKAPHITRAVAEKALVGSPKEVAENLMIVDLICHDLHGVVGEDVVVKEFCSVEEYETVWQLVSVIEGKSSGYNANLSDDQLGWEVLRRSLPPGSMTGAPKKRSVEILRSLEDQERSVYSGVFGYWCVGGGGDWSVTIRSCFKFDESAKNPAEELSHSSGEWIIGAGGAITSQSEPEKEWDEMVAKLESVLQIFNPTLSTIPS